MVVSEDVHDQRSIRHRVRALVLMRTWTPCWRQVYLKYNALLNFSPLFLLDIYFIIFWWQLFHVENSWSPNISVNKRFNKLNRSGTDFPQAAMHSMYFTPYEDSQIFHCLFSASQELPRCLTGLNLSCVLPHRSPAGLWANPFTGHSLM